MVRTRLRRFAVDHLPANAGAVLRLSEAASHHLLVVCRHQRGAALLLFDGNGREARAVLSEVDGTVAVVVLEEGPREARAAHELALVLGIPKGPALELALRMAVEVGVTQIYPVLADRSVRRSDRSDRWSRVLVAACQQCGRADHPRLAPLQTLGPALHATTTFTTRVVAVPGAHQSSPASPEAALAVGPEGGFTDAELRQFDEHGWQPMGLGPWTLRTDTAVAVGLAMVAHCGTS